MRLVLVDKTVTMKFLSKACVDASTFMCIYQEHTHIYKEKKKGTCVWYLRLPFLASLRLLFSTHKSSLPILDLSPYLAYLFPPYICAHGAVHTASCFNGKSPKFM